MRFGAKRPFGHLQFTGRSDSRVDKWYKLLPQLWGTELDFTEVGSYNEEKLYAVARLLAGAEAELVRADNQRSPLKVTDLLPLSEMDFGLTPGPHDDLQTRQSALASAMALSRGASAPNVVNVLKGILGPSFLAFVPSPAGASPTVYPSSPGIGPGAFKDVRVPPRIVQLVDPVVQTGSQWCAYEDIDTTSLPTLTWSASSSFAANQQILPLTGNGFFYMCTTAGTTGTAEPTWPTVPGQTVTDGSCVWTCVATIAPQLVKGDVIVVDAGNTSQMEQVTVTAVASTTQSQCTPGYLYFEATLTKAHDVGAVITTGDFPYWWSTQRLAYVVLTAASAIDRPTRAKVDSTMAKLTREVDQWATVQPTTTTAQGGTLGPLKINSPMGAVPIGSSSFTNSN